MIVETQNVQKYFGKVSAVRNLNLRVPEGSVFALIGTNGAGKTTTLRTLVNILKPDSGCISICGVDSRSLTAKDFFNIGYVSENQKLPEKLSIDQYFSFLRSLYPTWDRELEMKILKSFYLPPKRKIGQLSHGMRMKTILTAALSFRPRLLIMDEPLSGLDTLVRDEVIDGLLDLAGETTILISSHELAEIESFTTNIAFMAEGNLHFQESIDSLRNRFREISVTLSEVKTLPADYPHSWLRPSISEHILEYIDSAFISEEATYDQLTEHFGAIQFRETPMNLKDISIALIREVREATN